MMTYRERALAIFAHRPVDNTVYQPTIEHWYNVNKAQGTLPARYADMSLLDVYDDLDCSIRSYPWFNCCIRVQEDSRVGVESFEQDGTLYAYFDDRPRSVCDIERVRRVVDIFKEYERQPYQCLS